MININFTIEYSDVIYWSAIFVGIGWVCAFANCLYRGLANKTWKNSDDEFFTIFSFVLWPIFCLGLIFVAIGVFFLLLDDYIKIKNVVSFPARLSCIVIKKSYNFTCKTWKHFTLDRKIRKTRKEVIEAVRKQQEDIFNASKKFDNKNFNSNLKDNNAQAIN